MTRPSLNSGSTSSSTVWTRCGSRPDSDLIEPNGQVWGRPEYQPVDMRVVGVGIEPQPRQPVEYRVQQHPHLQPGQVHAQALVRPVAKRQVLLVLPEDVEGVR